MSKRQLSDRFQAIDTVELIQRARRVVGEDNISSIDVSRRGDWTRINLTERLLFADGSSGLPSVFIRNKNDGSTALQVHSGVFRLVCSNGMIIGTGSVGRAIHVQGQKLDSFLRSFEHLIIEGIDACYDSASISEELQAVPVSIDVGISTIASLNLTEKAKEQALVKWTMPEFRREEDRHNTQWTLYNIVNEQNRLRGRSASAAMDREITLLDDVRALSNSLIKAA